MTREFALQTLDDIEAVIRDFALDHFDWGEAGTARGFAYHLMVNRQRKGLLAIASDLWGYIRECECLGTPAVDSRNATEVLAMLETDAERARKRAEVADFIRDVKLEESAVYWNMLAHLATARDLGDVLQEMSPGHCRQVLNIIDRLHPLLKTNFTGYATGCYEPGANWALDHFVRKEIERLDVHLFDDPYRQEGGVERCEEVAALLCLFEHRPIREELTKAIEAEGAGQSATVDPRRSMTDGTRIVRRLATRRRRRGVASQTQ